MRIELLSFTKKGSALAQSLADKLTPDGHVCQISSTKTIPLSQWTEQAMSQADALVFIGACGIAVRGIAPFVKSKVTDPAVVVVDENARFALSLLSGHLGGANRLAKRIGDLLGATPVVTTATDGAGKFAVDEWADSLDCSICSMEAAKAVSMALLEGRPVGLSTDFPVSGPLPDGVILTGDTEVGICVSLNAQKQPYPVTLNLVPRVVSLGIGCKKDTSREAIEEAAEAAFKACGFGPEAVQRVCTIDLKANEPGLLEFCGLFGLALCTFSPEELKAVPGEFAQSAFVESVTGVDNVCERAASYGGRRLVYPRHAGNGVTMAVGVRAFTLYFEEPEENQP